MKRIYLLVLVPLLLLLAAVIHRTFIQPQTQTGSISPTPFASYTASFAVFTNGGFREFSVPMYFNKSEDVYIAAQNPNIVNVAKPNIAWQQFFDTLPMKLTPLCLTTGTNETFCTNEQTALRFYRNGTEDSQLLTRVIQPYDRVLISYGLITEEEVKRQYQSVPSLK